MEKYMSPDFDIKKGILPTTKPRSLGDRRPRGTCQGKAFWDNLTLAVW